MGMAEIYSAKEKVKERLSVSALRSTVGKTGSDNLLTSFASFPSKMSFETQDDDEEVILFLRQHPIVNVKW